MLFGSLAATWNEHLPVPLDKQGIRAYAEETVVIGLYRLESRMFRYWGQPQIGATGVITYLLQNRQNQELGRARICWLILPSIVEWATRRRWGWGRCGGLKKDAKRSR
jgi:CRISPR/Cas system endoribonuclease Cas6 (RAMP superfamily)